MPVRLCFYWLSGLPSIGTAVPQRKIPFVMPGQWLVNGNLEQMQLKWILFKQIAEYNEELDNRSVTASAEDSIISSPLTVDLKLHFMSPPAFFFFLFSPVVVGRRNVAVIERSQTWSYRGSLDGQPTTLVLISLNCHQGLRHSCREGSLALSSRMSVKRGRRQSPAAQTPSSVQNSTSFIKSSPRMSFSWLIKVSRKCEECVS